MSFEAREVHRSVIKLELPITIQDLRSATDWLLERYPNGTELEVRFGTLSGLVISGPEKGPGQ